MGGKISFIHTADLHLGRKSEALGGKGARLREKIQAAFANTVEAAIDRKADLVIIAGDLFDSPSPSGRAIKDFGREANKLLAAGVRLVVMPGTHDPPNSPVYRDPLFTGTQDGLYLLMPGKQAVVFDDLDIAVGAWIPDPVRAREWLVPPEGWHGGVSYKVAVAHGSAMPEIEGKAPEDMLPEYLLNNSDLDYVALGHHHGSGAAAGAKGAVYYSGSPEKLAVDQKEAGSVLHVVLEPGAAKVDVIQTGSLKYQKLSVDASEIMAGRDLEKEISHLADPDLYLDVEITGAAPLDAALPDPAGIEERLADGFFHLRVKQYVTRTGDLASADELPANSVAGEFVRIMKQRIEGAEDEEREEWEEALRVGLTYLSVRSGS